MIVFGGREKEVQKVPAAIAQEKDQVNMTPLQDSAEARVKLPDDEHPWQERDVKDQVLGPAEREKDRFDMPPQEDSAEARYQPSRSLSVISRAATPIYEDISTFPFGQPVATSLLLQLPGLTHGLSPQDDGSTTIVPTPATSRIDNVSKDIPIISTIPVNIPGPAPPVIVNNGGQPNSDIDYRDMVTQQHRTRGLHLYPESIRKDAGVRKYGAERVSQWVFDPQKNAWFSEFIFNDELHRYYEDESKSRATCPNVEYPHASGRCTYNPSTGHYWHTKSLRSYFMFVDEQGRAATAWLNDHETKSDRGAIYIPPQSLQPGATAGTRSRSMEELKEQSSLLPPEASSRLRSSSNGDLARMATQYLGIDDPQKVELQKMGSSVSLSSRPTFLTGYEVLANPAAFFIVGRVFNAMMDSKRWCFANPGDLLTKHHMKATLLVAQSGQGSCLCLRVSTYKGLGTTYHGIDSKDHAIIYTRPAGARTLAGEELNMWMTPLCVSSVTPNLQLDPMSRVDFGKTHVVSDQIAVREIGFLSEPLFLVYLKLGPLRDGFQHSGSSLPTDRSQAAEYGLYDSSSESGGIIRRGTVAGPHRAPSQVPENVMGRSKSVKSPWSSLDNAWLDTLHRVDDPTNFFVVGRVFSCAYDCLERRFLQQHDMADAKSNVLLIRHIFVVGAVDHQTITCVPINTYHGHGVSSLQEIPKALDHAIVYMVGKTPALLPGEPWLGEVSLKMIPLSHQTRLHPSSRINYGLCHRLEASVSVCELGALAEDSLRVFSSVVKDRLDTERRWWVQAAHLPED